MSMNKDSFKDMCLLLLTEVISEATGIPSACVQEVLDRMFTVPYYDILEGEWKNPETESFIVLEEQPFSCGYDCCGTAESIVIFNGPKAKYHLSYKDLPSQSE